MKKYQITYQFGAKDSQDFSIMQGVQESIYNSVEDGFLHSLHDAEVLRVLSFKLGLLSLKQ